MLTKEQALIEVARYAKSVSLSPSRVVHRFLGAAFYSTPAEPRAAIESWISEIDKNMDAQHSFWTPTVICESWECQQAYVASIVNQA